MTTPNPGYVAAYRRALSKKGVEVIFTRISGFAPNTATISATVTAVVQDAMPDTTSPAQTGFPVTKVGAITQSQRTLIVMATDLADARFPLPLKKNDKATIVSTNEELNIIEVDPNKRASAGAIEVKASGTA